MLSGCIPLSFTDLGCAEIGIFWACQSFLKKTLGVAVVLAYLIFSWLLEGGKEESTFLNGGLNQ